MILGSSLGAVNFQARGRFCANVGGVRAGDRLASMNASGKEAAPGELYIVATPIGNLDDITLRALRVLKEASLIACEDTRQTGKLLDHYGITTRTVSYHAHNEEERAAELVRELRGGANIALVSDAGTPAISDPGFRVVASAIAHGIRVVPIPGAVAFAAAAAASGLPTDSFRFGGFLPAKRGQRRQALEQIQHSSCTEVYYEAPHRVKQTMEDVLEILGEERPVVVARELTKIHEEFLRGSALAVANALNARGEVKGEITLLIGKAETKRQAAAGPSLRQRLQEIIASENLDQKTALKRVAREMGISRSEAYRALQRSK